MKEIYVMETNKGCIQVLNCLEYPMRTIKGKSIGLHRYVFEQVYGPIPKGIYVCHSCDNNKCINPEHLFLGTAKDNQQDALSKGKRKRAKNKSKEYTTW